MLMKSIVLVDKILAAVIVLRVRTLSFYNKTNRLSKSEISLFNDSRCCNQLASEDINLACAVSAVDV